MKHIQISALMLVLLAFFAQGCGTAEPSERQFISPEGACTVTVSSTGGTWRSPARVTVSVSSSGQALASTVEVYHDSLTAENCVLTWNQGVGVLILKHRDGATREMEIHYTGEKLYMVDRKSGEQ